MAFKSDKEENLDVQNIELLLSEKQSTPNQVISISILLEIEIQIIFSKFCLSEMDSKFVLVLCCGFLRYISIWF
jgi:hypothetical protein